MSTRELVRLKAPANHGEEVVVANHPYFPSYGDDPGCDDRFVETAVAEHVPVLKQHGFVEVSRTSMAAPQRRLASVIEVDELGRGELADALRDRGISYPPASSRAELADIAERFNQGLTRGRARDKASGLVPVHQLQSERSTGADGGGVDAPDSVAELRGERRAAPSAPAGGEAEDEVGPADTDDYDGLKGWLTAHAVQFSGRAPKATLQQLVNDKLGAMRRAREAREAAAAPAP